MNRDTGILGPNMAASRLQKGDAVLTYVRWQVLAVVTPALENPPDQYADSLAQNDHDRSDHQVKRDLGHGIR
jgi:hypothetical protein